MVGELSTVGLGLSLGWRHACGLKLEVCDEVTTADEAH